MQTLVLKLEVEDDLHFKNSDLDDNSIGIAKLIISEAKDFKRIQAFQDFQKSQRRQRDSQNSFKYHTFDDASSHSVKGFQSPKCLKSKQFKNCSKKLPRCLNNDCCQYCIVNGFQMRSEDDMKSFLIS